MTDCLFCKMIAGEIKPDIVYENEDVFAFKDVNPQAPVHILIIPKKHISTINDLEEEDIATQGKLFIAAKTIAQDSGFAEQGYRTVMNCNAMAGQSVYHIHLHLLAGRVMTWPPG